jgi:hypothetical protein
MTAAMQDFSLLHSRARKQRIGCAVKIFVTFVRYAWLARLREARCPSGILPSSLRAAFGGLFFCAERL